MDCRKLHPGWTTIFDNKTQSEGVKHSSHSTVSSNLNKGQKVAELVNKELVKIMHVPEEFVCVAGIDIE